MEVVDITPDEMFMVWLRELSCHTIKEFYTCFVYGIRDPNLANFYISEEVKRLLHWTDKRIQQGKLSVKTAINKLNEFFDNVTPKSMLRSSNRYHLKLRLLRLPERIEEIVNYSAVLSINGEYSILNSDFLESWFIDYPTGLDDRVGVTNIAKFCDLMVHIIDLFELVKNEVSNMKDRQYDNFKLIIPNSFIEKITNTLRVGRL